MIRKTSQKLKEKIGRKNVKTFLLFVAFTTFLWLALQFSKNYSQEIEFNIDYTNVPKEKLIIPKTNDKLKMVLEGNGFQLLKYALFQKTVLLDASQAANLHQDHAYFTGNTMLNAIKTGLDYKGKIAYVLKDSIHIYYDVFEEKQLDLQLVSEISYAQGYTSIEGLTSSINKVNVIGPKLVLDTLKSVRTKTLILDNVKKDYSGNLEIQPFENLPEVKIPQKSIPVTLAVNKLTEGEFKVPIVLKNVPKDSKIQLFPKTVAVVFSVALNDYKKLSAKDFKVSANLKEASEGNNLNLNLDSHPKNVYNARLRVKTVQYVIINE